MSLPETIYIYYFLSEKKSLSIYNFKISTNQQKKIIKSTKKEMERTISSDDLILEPGSLYTWHVAIRNLRTLLMSAFRIPATLMSEMRYKKFWNQRGYKTSMLPFYWWREGNLLAYSIFESREMTFVEVAFYDQTKRRNWYFIDITCCIKIDY